MTKLSVPLNNKIKQLLISHPELRDDDILLMAAVWSQEIENLLEIRMSYFFYMLSNKMLTSPESIRRTRQHVQKEWPKTRGLLYKNRHSHAKTVKETLKSLPFLAGGTP